MTDWHHVEARPGDDPRDVEAARKGSRGTHSIDAHRQLRELIEKSNEMQRVFAKSPLISRPPRSPKPPSRLMRWLRGLFQ